MTTPGITLDDIKHETARRDFLDFLKYVRIQDTDPYSGTVEMPFVLWPHLEELASDLMSEKLLIVLKARQLGVTWLMAAYAEWLAAYHEGVVVLVVSKGELESKQFISRMKFVHDRLPEGLKASGVTPTTEKWTFANGSSVNALPASSTAGRSFTASLIIHDEADYHPDLESAITASRPSIDGGGKHVIVSTANYENSIDSYFKRMYIRARDHLSNYKARFYSWNVRPDRDAKWRADITADYELDRRQKEYPETEQEALAPPETLAGIPAWALDSMATRCREPLEFMAGQPADSRIYERFWPGHLYTAFTDTAHGTGGDYSITGILDCDTETVVADIFSQWLKPHELAYQSVRLLELYGNPLWGIEDNEWGILVIHKAEEMEYRNLYHRPTSDHDHSPGRVGWTTNRKTRPLLVGELQESCLAGHLTVYARDGLGQFYDLVRNPDKDGRIEAAGGRHDDYPVMVGGALMMKKSGYARHTSPSLHVTNDRDGSWRVGRRARSRRPRAPQRW